MQNEQHQGGFWARMGVISFLVSLVAGAGFLALSQTADLQAQSPPAEPVAGESADAAGGPTVDASGASQGVTDSATDDGEPDDGDPAADAEAGRTTPEAEGEPAETLQERLERLEQEVAALRGAITENSDNIQDLFVQTDELAGVVKEDIERRLDAISEPDPSRDGYFVPRVYGNMDTSTYFAEQMEKAVDATMKGRSCTLRIVNRTATQQMLRINDEGSWILLDVGQELEQQFPAGAVVTRLPGQDPITWFLGPPNYRQDVQIVIR